MDKPAAVRLIRKSFRRALVAGPRSYEGAGAETDGRVGRRRQDHGGPDHAGPDPATGRDRGKCDKGTGRKVHHGALQELGWRQGRKELGDKRRKIPGKHYMKRAYEQLGQSATGKAEEYLWDEIVKVFGAKAGY